MIARMNDIQKLRQKSHSNISDNTLGDIAMKYSLIPALLIYKIIKAAPSVMYIRAESNVIKYTVDIILLLLS